MRKIMRKMDENADNIWKLTKFANWREYDEKQAKRNTIAAYFLNLSVVTFGGMVISIIAQIAKDGFKLVTAVIIVSGVFLTYTLAWVGYKLLKMKGF